MVVSVLRDRLCNNNYDLSICCGDLFDTTENSSSTILSGWELIKNTDYCLAGNHDVVNQRNAASSMNILHAAFPDRVCIGGFRRVQLENTVLFMLPHQISQEKFVEELRLVNLAAIQEPLETRKLLFLHCMYNSGFEPNETSLNLTEEVAKGLLGVFQYILIGHEHVQRDALNGRVKIIGSIFPSSFEDLNQPSRFLLFDTGTGQFNNEEVGVSHWKGRASQFFGSEAQFITLEDDLEPGITQRLAINLYNEGALAVRILDKKIAEASPFQQRSAIQSLPKAIEDDLRAQEPELLPVWQSLLHEEAIQ